MSLRAYLRSHAVRVVCSVAVVALLAVMLPVVGVERGPPSWSCFSSPCSR